MTNNSQIATEHILKFNIYLPNDLQRTRAK